MNNENWQEKFEIVWKTALASSNPAVVFEGDEMRNFIKETLENELHERDKDWQKLMKETLAAERERVLGELWDGVENVRIRSDYAIDKTEEKSREIQGDFYAGSKEFKSQVLALITSLKEKK